MRGDRALIVKQQTGTTFDVKLTPIPNSQFPIPDSRFPIPDSRFPIPDSQFPIPNSRFPIPNSQFPMPNSRFPMPNSQFPIPHSVVNCPWQSRFQKLCNVLTGSEVINTFGTLSAIDIFAIFGSQILVTQPQNTVTIKGTFQNRTFFRPAFWGFKAT